MKSLARNIFITILSGVLFACTALDTSSTVRTAIVKEIDEHPEIGGHNLTIDARGGVVTLTGSVSTEADRALIGEIARRQLGVRRVENRLLLSPVRAAFRSDTAAAIRDSLKGHPELRDYNVDISEAAPGSVILSGRTGSAREAAVIEQIARDYPGVNSVNIRLVYPEEPSDAQLTARVERGLREDPEVDLRGVHIQTRSGLVFLSGIQPSQTAIDRILTITLMIPGVKDVRSGLTVSR